MPEWKYGDRQALLLEDPVLLLMAVPLRQQMSWEHQVMPALHHFRRSDFCGQTLAVFYHGAFMELTEGFSNWHEGAVALWGRKYWRSCQMLFELLHYVLSGEYIGTESGHAGDWARLRRAFLADEPDDVLPRVYGLGPSSLGFLAYYLTEHPPEHYAGEFLRLYRLEYGVAETTEFKANVEDGDSPALDVRRAWLKMLYDGVLHMVEML